MIEHIKTFAELKRRLDALPDQVVGQASSVCETGEPYVEFSETAPARPDDISIVEAFVVEKMSSKLFAYLNARAGRIYWRTPLEWAVSDRPQVISFDDIGPDWDFITDRHCVMDKDWKVVACYCRLYKALAKGGANDTMA